MFDVEFLLTTGVTNSDFLESWLLSLGKLWTMDETNWIWAPGAKELFPSLDLTIEFGTFISYLGWDDLPPFVLEDDLSIQKH